MLRLPWVRLTPGFQVVGEADSGEAAVELVDRLHPALVLMDVNMGAINGNEATGPITTTHPDVVVLLLSTYHSDELPSETSTSGYAGNVDKDEFGSGVLREFGAGR